MIVSPFYGRYEFYHSYGPVLILDTARAHVEKVFAIYAYTGTKYYYTRGDISIK